MNYMNYMNYMTMLLLTDRWTDRPSYRDAKIHPEGYILLENVEFSCF